ncbi:MAG: DUF3108 domain-containing protein [Desulforhopalus sp.]
MYSRCFFILLGLLVLFFSQVVAGDKENVASSERTIPVGVINPKLLSNGYSGHEKFTYDVSWTGGIKIGEIQLQINALSGSEEEYEIRALVTTKNGAIDFFYPVEDIHVTRIRGSKRLPYHYEVWQKEGRDYRAHRVTEYDQATGSIRYTKNGKLEGVYQVAGEVNNEFSSFFNSRLMDFHVGSKFIVPTFADKRRVEVVVNAVSRELIDDTVFGPVATMAVMPVLTFAGLYEKKGDTIIWYTDDQCRVPVQVNSKIVLGSLTARLKEYENVAADCYSAVNK